MVLITQKYEINLFCPTAWSINKRQVTKRGRAMNFDTPSPDCGLVQCYFILSSRQLSVRDGENLTVGV